MVPALFFCVLSAAAPEPAAPAPPPAPSVPVAPHRQVYRMQLTGGVLLVFGAVTMVGMGAAIGYGRGVERERREALEAGVAPGQLAELQRRETRADAAAIAAGLVGVALVGTGVALFIVAKQRQRRAVTLGPGPGLFGFSLQARFERFAGAQARSSSG
ncbi:hypothetical protein [Nannocystis pusilla]|uniref:hypothetical protein n=1 Tax=Nannocystis pusilla TaxID=889268 RepID=UPI003B7E18AB